MKVKDNIEWLKSLKKQIGQTQHRDLWHFEQVIDETIANLEPLAKPHGRLIDADALHEKADSQPCFWKGAIDELMAREAPTVIEAEVE